LPNHVLALHEKNLTRKSIGLEAVITVMSIKVIDAVKTSCVMGNRLAVLP
jgi:hypothetical protein